MYILIINYSANIQNYEKNRSLQAKLCNILLVEGHLLHDLPSYDLVPILFGSRLNLDVLKNVFKEISSLETIPFFCCMLLKCCEGLVF